MSNWTKELHRDARQWCLCIDTQSSLMEQALDELERFRPELISTTTGPFGNDWGDWYGKEVCCLGATFIAGKEANYYPLYMCTQNGEYKERADV